MTGHRHGDPTVCVVRPTSPTALLVHVLAPSAADVRAALRLARMPGDASPLVEHLRDLLELPSDGVPLGRGVLPDSAPPAPVTVPWDDWHPPGRRVQPDYALDTMRWGDLSAIGQRIRESGWDAEAHAVPDADPQRSRWRGVDEYTRRKLAEEDDINGRIT